MLGVERRLVSIYGIHPFNLIDCRLKNASSGGFNVTLPSGAHDLSDCASRLTVNSISCSRDFCDMENVAEPCVRSSGDGSGCRSEN